MICLNEGCGKEFEKTTHNQKYCSDECCRESTNQKIKEKYREKKERLSGKKRVCSTRGCRTELSKYNEEKVCDSCVAKNKSKELNELLRILNRGSI